MTAAVSPSTARALEFDTLLELVAQLASTDLGRERVRALAPAPDPAELAARRTRLEEAQRLLGDGALVPGSEEPYATLLDGLAHGRPPVGGPELVRLGSLLRATRAAVKRVVGADPACPRLAELVAGLPDAAPLQQAIERTLDRRGEVREDASPELAELRRTIRRQRERLYKELGGHVETLREHLSEETIPLRNGRLVLVLQAGARGRVPGLLHGRSATGKSYYFEPFAAVEGNNQLQQALEDEEAERRRILAELLALARAELPTLAAHAQLAAELDTLQAAARFAETSGGRLAELGPAGELRLAGARHPLLDPRLASLRESVLGQAGHTGPVVPLDLELGGERRVLVVTGPNAGGKTVALKTAGLLALAHLCGLPVPVGAGSRLPFLERLVATVGDEQDLLADRSTFSGRLLRLREAWDAAGPESLVLLDELGSGTDPEEGAALATALLEGLLERGALGVITTHLTQLAAAALELAGAGCAAMEFDPSTGRPTFRLLPGPPGGSEAIALARRLGLPREWLERAEARLGAGQRELRRLLGEVERARQELAAAHARLEGETAAAEAEHARLERERAALEAERRSLGARLQRELDAFRRDTAQRLSGEVERLRADLAAGKKRGLAGAAVERLFAAAPELQVVEEAGPVEVGERVRHRRLGWEGTLERVDDGRAQVLVGGKRLRCGVEELAPAAAAAPEAGARGAGVARGAAASHTATTRGARARGDLPEAHTLARELNLIGQRVEPALDALDAYLDQALLASQSEVRIVHGHGTGRLREAVRGHLREHPAVAAQRPGEPNEGGNGATVVRLREADG